MTEHHKHASEAVARTIFDGMPPDEQAQVIREAREKGVEPLDIVRSALDVLIETSDADRDEAAKRPNMPRGVVKQMR